jgi:hypothetical protein
MPGAVAKERNEREVTIMFNRFSLFTILFSLLMVFGAARAQSVLVDIGSANGTAGSVVQVPVAIESTSSAQPVGLQLDISFNTSYLTFNQCTTGAAAAAAEKSASCNTLSAGNLRLLVAGLNQRVMANGIVTWLEFRIAAGLSAFTTPLTASKIKVSDFYAQFIASTGGNGMVIINGGIANPKELYFSHLADGGGYKTTLLLVNPGSSPVNGLLELFTQNGTKFLINMNGSLDNAFLFSLPAKGLTILESAGTNTQPQVGWARLRSSATVGGSVVYGYYGSPGALVSEAGIFSSVEATSFSLSVDTRRGLMEGLAIANPNSTAISLVLTLYNAAGTQLRQETRNLAGLNQFALLMGGTDQLFNGVDFSSFTGIVTVTATGGEMIGTTLRFSPNLAVFTSIPVI